MSSFKRPQLPSLSRSAKAAKPPKAPTRQPTVLFDAPGPRARRRILIGSVIAVVALLLLVLWVVLKLEDQGQLSEEKWGPLVDPGNENFDVLWEGLLKALRKNVTAAALAMVFSLVIGTVLAMTRLSLPRYARWAVVGPMEILRGIPVVMTIFFAARVLPDQGLEFDKLWYLVIGLTAYNCVIIAEIVRAGVVSLPKGQSEAASAVGLTRLQSMTSVQLPQAFRAMLPALISQLVVIFKDTSLGFVILYPEALKFAQIATQTTRNPLQLYFVVGVIFIVINYALSKFAEWVERRISRPRSAADPTAARQLGADQIAGGGAGGIT